MGRCHKTVGAAVSGGARGGLGIHRICISPRVEPRGRRQNRAPVQPEAAGGIGGNVLAPGLCYVRVSLAKMRLQFSGRLWKDFYPVAQSSIELSRENANRITVPFVVDPGTIANLAHDNGQVIEASNIDLLPTTPYIGGGINVALSLSSAVSKDYLQNALDLLTSLSSVVGGTTLTSAATVSVRSSPAPKHSWDLTT